MIKGIYFLVRTVFNKYKKLKLHQRLFFQYCTYFLFGSAPNKHINYVLFFKIVPIFFSKLHLINIKT